ncbi:MAG: hypothetical protein KGZ70_13080 [Hydrogenophaga sp.]|nr:hypothetical protein [Hydrogenophaga sp.]
MRFRLSMLRFFRTVDSPPQDLKREKQQLLACLDRANLTDALIIEKIRHCTSHSDLVLVRADVMQRLANEIGEAQAASLLLSVWTEDAEANSQ